MSSWEHLYTAQITHGKDKMAEALTIVASLFTIWAQSSILAENKEFDRFKQHEPVQEEIREEKPEEPRLIVLAETKL